MFSKYRVNRPLDVCTECCMEIADEARLASLPVRQIPVELLSKYNGSAHSTKIDIEKVILGNFDVKESAMNELSLLYEII